MLFLLSSTNGSMGGYEEKAISIFVEVIKSAIMSN